MANNDILTMTERIKTLGALIKTLQSIQTEMSAAQTYYDSSSDFGSKNPSVELRMTNIGTMLDQVADELVLLYQAKNLKFQHIWKVGTHDIGCIKFEDNGGSADSIKLYTGLAADAGYNISETFTSAIATGDRIKVSGTTSNDGEYVITADGSPFSNSITVATALLVAEECVTSGAKITKVRDEV